MLKLGRIKISDVRFGKKTKIKNGVLYIEKKELLEAAKANDERIVQVEADIAKPRTSTRIIPIKDVIEPRVKVKGIPGQGYTLALKGMSVITCGQIVGFQEGLLDMSGPAAEYSYFSKLINVVLTAKVEKDLEKHRHEEALRLLGLRAAEYLAQAGKELKPDKIEKFETLFPQKKSPLPRIIYIYMILSQGLLHDTYIYGRNSRNLVPIFLQPAEVMDGVITSGNCVSACDKNTTYHHQNNPIIKELYERHKKELNFIGVIITNENTVMAEKQDCAEHTVELAKSLGAQGAIISKEGFGNPDTDLMLIYAGLEENKIETICLTDEFAGSDGASQSLADVSQKADAVVSTGNANEKILLQPMKKIIGDERLVTNLTGGYPKSLKKDGSLEIELQAIMGATNQLGFEKLSAREV